MIWFMIYKEKKANRALFKNYNGTMYVKGHVDRRGKFKWRFRVVKLSKKNYRKKLSMRTDKSVKKEKKSL